MRGLIKKWASQYLYTTGPKAGSPSKIAPGALVTQGIQPGTGQKISAEEMNAALALCLESVALGRLNAVQFSSVGTLTTALEAAAWDAYAGMMTGVSVGHDRVYFSSSPSESAAASTIFSTSAGHAAVPAKNAAGEPRVLLFGRGTAATTQLTCHSVQNTTTATGSLTLSGVTVDIGGACYDEVNGAVIVFVHDTAGAGAHRIARVLDASSTPVAATTHPAGLPTYVATSTKNALAAGGGVALLIAREDSSVNIFGARSTDGGETWNAITLPTPAATSDISGVFYSEDFLGEGPAFCFHYTNTTGSTAAVYYSRDLGVSWQSVAAPYRSAGAQAFIFGDLLVGWNGVDFLIMDLLSGDSMIRRPTIGTFTRLLSDGHRLLYVNSSNVVHATPFLKAPPNRAGTAQTTC